MVQCDGHLYLIIGKVKVMNDNKNKVQLADIHTSSSDPTIKMCLDGRQTVTIRFSRTESDGTKDCVRDILTNAYEERFQRMLNK